MKKIPIYLKLLLILLTSIIIGTLLMVCIYLLPTKQMTKHVKDSINVFYSEDMFHRVSNVLGGTLDNHTESVMLGTAIYDGNESIINKALLNYRYVTNIDPIHALKVQVIGVKKDITTYSRYWHGYLVYLKPLLIFFNYETIRIINALGIICITLYFLYVMYKNNLKQYCIPYIITFILINPAISFNSIDFSNLIYIFTISQILIIKKKDIWTTKHYIYLFFIIGIIVAFTDFLTFPLTTICLPMIFYFLINNHSDNKNNIKTLIIFSFSWFFGYVGMWAGKWVVASIFTKENIIINALNQIEMRSSNVSEMRGIQVNLPSILARNFKEYYISPFAIPLIIIFIYYLFKIIKNKYYTNNLNIFINFILIAIFPIVWYMLIKGHSYDHYFFTFKLLMITSFSILSMLIKCIDINKEDNLSVSSNQKI